MAKERGKDDANDQDAELRDDEDERFDAKENAEADAEALTESQRAAALASSKDDDSDEDERDDGDDEEEEDDDYEDERSDARENAEADADSDDEDSDDEDEDDEDSDDEDSDDEDEDNEPPKAKRATAGGKRAASKTRPARDASPAAPESSNGLVWLAVGAAVLLGGWWLWKGRDPGPEMPTAPSAAVQPQTEPPAPQPAPPEPEVTPPPLEPPPATPEPSAAEAEPAAAAPEAEPTEPAPEPAAGGGGTFDRAVALRALAEASKSAARCRMAGAPPGAVRVSVSFGPSGAPETVKVTHAPYAGTQTAKCVQDKLKAARMDAFSGTAQTVITSVQVY